MLESVFAIDAKEICYNSNVPQILFNTSPALNQSESSIVSQSDRSRELDDSYIVRLESRMATGRSIMLLTNRIKRSPAIALKPEPK